MAQNYTQTYNRSASQRANPYNDPTQQPEDYASQLWQSAFNNTTPGLAGLGGASGGGAVPGIQPQQPQQPPPVSSFVNQKPSGGLGSGVVQGGLQQGGATGQQPQATPWLPGSFGASGNYSQQAQQSPLALSSGGQFDSRSGVLPTLPQTTQPQTSSSTLPSIGATYDPSQLRYSRRGQLIPPGFIEDENGNVVWDTSNANINPPPGIEPQVGPSIGTSPYEGIDQSPLPETSTTDTTGGTGGTGTTGTGGGRFQGTANPNWFGGFNLSRQYDASSAKGTFMVLAEQSGVDPTAFSKEQSEAWFRQHIQPGLEAAGFEVMDVQGDKAFIRTTENPSGEWIDFVSNAGGGNAQYAWQSDHDPGAATGGAGTSSVGTQESLSPFANRKGDGDGRDGLGQSYGGVGDTSGLSADQRQNGLWGNTQMPDYAQQIMAWLFGEGQNLYNR